MTIKNPLKSHSFPLSRVFIHPKKEALRVTRKVGPGKPGAVRELAKYGDKLRAVRYLKDDAGRYIKTVELIVAERHET